MRSAIWTRDCRDRRIESSRPELSIGMRATRARAESCVNPARKISWPSSTSGSRSRIVSTNFLRICALCSGELQLLVQVVAKLQGFQCVVGGGHDRHLEAVDLVEAQALERRAAGGHEILLDRVVDGKVRSGAKELFCLLKVRPRLEFYEEFEGAVTFQRHILHLAIEPLQVDLFGEPEKWLEWLCFSAQGAVDSAEDDDL